MSRTVAALYVIHGGPYYGLADVEPWGLPERDAREYAGPWPVVAHPPCARWGRYWSGGPSAKVRRELGDDDGCFSSALAAVRRWGGVIEHPQASHAWKAHGLLPPPWGGGWVAAGDFLGWTCCVEQGNYGHRARKATWLYVVGAPSLPSLRWGPSARKVRLDQGFHTAEERRKYMSPPPGMTAEDRAKRRDFLAWYEEQSGKVFAAPERMGKREMAATPAEFRDLLLSIARTTKDEE